uniref:Uncharacterized protein n=1 Tax=Myotis myotis TaxID=51298 RepID=A0A7J7RCZ6_MYOMY|nr:hypothetical protein mMyoMyo1_010828 [Myotis myotis]
MTEASQHNYSHSYSCELEPVIRTRGPLCLSDRVQGHVVKWDRNPRECCKQPDHALTLPHGICYKIKTRLVGVVAVSQKQHPTETQLSFSCLSFLNPFITPTQVHPWLCRCGTFYFLLSNLNAFYFFLSDSCG